MTEPHEQHGDPSRDDPHIPLSPSARGGGEPKGRIDAPSLTDEASAAADRCPKCGAEMSSPDAVVCVKCGYDMRSNKPAKTEVGAAKDGDEGDEAPAEATIFIEEDHIGWKIPLVIGAAALVSAATLAGVQAEGGWLRAVVRVLLYGPLQIGLGVGAVAITARLLEERVGRLELALGRMTLAIGLFYLFFMIGQTMNLHPAVQWMIGAGLGGAAYFLVVWLMFAIWPAVALMLAGVHFALWLVLKGTVVLIDWIESAPGAASTAATGGGG